MPPEIGLGSDYELQDPLGLYSGSTGLGGKPAAPPAEPNAPPPPPAQVDQSAPAQPFASAGSEGEIRRGPDGKNYQYVETTGMAGATGANGWIPTSQSAPADAKQTAAPAGTPAHIPGNPAASGMARLAPPDPVAPAGKGGQLAFAHPGQDQLNPAFRTLLSTTSTDIGRNLMLTSAYRSPQHSVEAAKKEPGEHAHRDAADISMAGMDDAARAQLVSTLQANGAKRFITYSHEPDMLHVDMNSKRVSADNWFMYDRSHNNLGRAPKWFQDVAAGSKPLAATGSDDSAGASSAVAADENFKPSDPMGIYSGTTNPLAPKPIELRPFTAGEKRPNADGSYSTEVSTTFQLPDGQWVNVPSLWMGSNGKPKQFSPTDEKDIIGAMTAFEAKNGPTFARFPTVGAAEEAAQARSAAGGAAAGNPLGQKAAADPLQSIWQGMDKKEPGRYQVIPAADYEKWHKDWEAGQSSQIVKGFKGALLDQNPELLGNAMEAVGVLSDVQKMKDVAGVVKDWGKQGSYKRQAAVGSVSDIRTDTWSNMISDAGSYAAYSLGSGVGSMVPNVAVGLGVGTATANPVVGFVAGAAGPSYIQNLGDVYGSLRDDPNIQKRVASGDVTQKQVAGWAAAAAVPMAALDSVSLGKVLNIAGGKAIKDRLVKRIAKGIIEGSLTEGTTEALQQVISETVQEELGANKPLADKIISVVDNFIGGALTGGVAGGAGHASPHGGIDMAPGGPADAAAPVAPTAGPTAPAAPAPGASPGPTAPAAPATRKGPLAAALEHGERKAIERSNLPPPLPEGAPAIGVTVRVDAPGLQPFMGKIDSYQDGEAMLHDSASGEIYQIPISHLTAIAPSYEEFNKAADAKAPPSAPVTATPAPPIATPTAEPAAEKPAGIPLVITGGMRAELGNMGYDNTSIREMTPEMAHSILMGRTEHDVTDPALRPAFKETAPVTTAELPPREEQKPAVQAFPGPPAPGQRVIVDHPGIPRFSGKIETYEGDDVVVVDDNGTSQQVPLASLYVSKLQPKQIEAQDLARDPPAAREKPVLDKSTDRVVSNKTIIFPDTKHAGLYDLGKIRMESQRTMGVSVLDRGSVAPAEQAKIAAEFGVTPEAAGQMADDYRYRAERYGKEGRSALPIKMHAVNDRRLKQWQASAAKAAGLDVTAGGTDLSAWWDGELTAAGRKGILDATGIKRNEKTTWRNLGANLRTKITEHRNATAVAAPTGEFDHDWVDDADREQAKNDRIAREAIDQAAHAAATSPQNELPEPTPAQKEAGNYTKGHVRLGGMDISIENPEGSERKGVDKKGTAWSIKMKSHYGYIKGTIGKDKDHIDTFIKPGTAELADDAPVFVVDQVNPDRRLDEHKVMMGYGSIDEAKAAYQENYAKGWKGLGAITPTTTAGFKDWLEKGDTKFPFSTDVDGKHPGIVEEVDETPEVFAGGKTPTTYDAKNDKVNYGAAGEPFPAPAATLDPGKGLALISQADAKARVSHWKAIAKKIGKDRDNSKKVIVSLFDETGSWSQPWRDAGYQVIQLDAALGDDIFYDSPGAMMDDIAQHGGTVVGVLAATPCTTFAGSGARWWEERHNAASNAMVEKLFGPKAAQQFDTPVEANAWMVHMSALYVDLMKPKFHVLENPIGRIGEMTGLPKPLVRFDPADFGDPYTKRTQLWGDFDANLPTAPVAASEGSKMQSKLRGDNAADKRERSKTPEGFAYAFFMANDPDARAALADAEKADQAGKPESQISGKAESAISATARTLHDQTIVDVAKRVVEASGSDVAARMASVVRHGGSNAELLATFEKGPGKHVTGAGAGNANGTARNATLHMLMPGPKGERIKPIVRGKQLADALRAAFTDYEPAAGTIIEQTPLGSIDSRFGSEPSFYTALSTADRATFDGAVQANKDVALLLGAKIDQMKVAGDGDRAQRLEGKLAEILAAMGVGKKAAGSAATVQQTGRSPITPDIAKAAIDLLSEGYDWDSAVEEAKRRARGEKPRAAPKTPAPAAASNAEYVEQRQADLPEGYSFKRAGIETTLLGPDGKRIAFTDGQSKTMIDGMVDTAIEKAKSSKVAASADLHPIAAEKTALRTWLADMPPADFALLAKSWGGEAEIKMEVGVSSDPNKLKTMLEADLATAKAAAAQSPAADRFAGNKLFTADRVEAARARLKAKMNQVNSGIDPEVLIDGLTIAGAYIEAGVRDFSEFAKQMASDFGPGIKPFLLSFWEGARNYPGLDNAGMTPVAAAAKIHSELNTTLPVEAAAALGSEIKAPARAKRSGRPEDRTLNQDWGVEHIDGYGTDPSRETGNDVKDAFLKDASQYLKAVSTVLLDQGFTVGTDGKGRPMKAVSVNEAGPAGSGDVSLRLDHPDTGARLYATVGASSLRGTVPTTASGIAIMFRDEKRGLSGSQNRWAPVGLSAGELAAMMAKEAGGGISAAEIARPSVEAPNAAAKLEGNGESALEGAPSGTVQVAPGGRVARPRAGAGGEPDLFGSQPAGSVGPVVGRSVADGAGGVSSPETGGRRGTAEPVVDVAADDAGTGAGPARNADRVKPSAGTPAALLPTDYAITDADELGAGGQKAKYRGNVAAIRLLRTLEAGGRLANRDEQAVLAKWVGWGGLRPAFEREGGEVNKGWEKEAAELKALLTPEEYRAAESSTRNAHYTSAQVVSAIWDIVKQLGFSGGRVLEPSIGAGNFIGLMPGQWRDAARVTGVELDHITGGIAKNLYPKADIATPIGFQDFSTPNGHFDLAIGNPPFGSERLYDADRRELNKFSIHNFFFAKSIDALRPGGILAMVVTNSFLDAETATARAYIAARADLLGAIRLPNTAFLDNAGTQVTTDIIVLQKREEGTAAADLSWVQAASYQDKEGRTVKLNQYFKKRPEMMLGEFGAYGTMYRGDSAALVSRPDDDLPELLRNAIKRLPERVMPAPGSISVEKVEVPNTVDTASIGSAFLSPEGDVFVRKPDSLGHATAEKQTFANDAAKERVSGMIRVRDAFARLRKAQIDDKTQDKQLDELRARLNTVYDAFARKHGPINVDANKRLFRDDPTWPQISALEEKFDKGVSATVAKTTGEVARGPSAQKAPIFTKRTQQPYKRPTSASSAKDALATVLADLGRVDLDAMQRLYGKSADKIVAELGPLLWKTPAGAYETADAYLSGNVKAKLAEAQRAAVTDPDFRRNVEALQNVIPPDIEAVDINVKPGSPWVPATHVTDFINHMTEKTGGKSFYSKANAKWAITVPMPSPAATVQWSTDRAGMSEILGAVLNGSTVTVYDRDSDGKTHLNQPATDAANEKAEKVKAEWRRWLWEDDGRRDELARLYNDIFNTDVLRKYDGGHLNLPGKVGDDIIDLRPHQKSFVWRSLQTGTALADHVVGAGKTFALIAAIMEKRRTGQAKKPILVVPNHLVGQWASDFVKLYPGAKVLATTKKDFDAENRKRLFARIITGDWDVVIVAHSSFGRIGVSPEFEKAFIAKQMTELEASMTELRNETGEKSRNVAQLAKWRENLNSKLQRLLDAGAKDDGLTFDEMGIDDISVDEAHEFKNLAFATAMTRVAGLGNPMGSQKAADLYMKIQSITSRNGGRGVTFATGTPLSNTMAEMYTVQRYLDPKGLEALGVAHFDAWARVFGEVVSDWELSPSGQYKLKSRFSKFVNMPELMKRYLSFADVITNDDIKAQLAAIGKKLPLPKVKGGKPTNVVVERSRDQASYIGVGTNNQYGNLEFPKGSLVYRAENLPKGKPEKGSDNMLKVMSDARKAALDMRLIDPSYPDVAGSKVHVAADNMRRLYDKWDAKKGTQLVFIDLSTPKKAKAKEEARIRELMKKADAGDEAAQEAIDNMSPDEFDALNGSFSVYDDLRQKLLDRGIPESEIAFIHDANTDAQKEELFGKVRSGRVRLLFGSTAKMGAGTNVQNRMVALHHLDAPWRPSDLEQRDGRGIRQGNELYGEDPEGFELEILRYATKNTLDARQWQTIEGKARFIQQVRKGGSSTREIEDIAGEASNAAEMKAAASGNPLILEEMDLRQKLRKLTDQGTEHDREQHRIRGKVKDMRNEIDRNAVQMPIAEADAESAREFFSGNFSATIEGKEFEKPGAMGAAIIAAGRRLLEEKVATTVLGKIGAFTLDLEHRYGTSFELTIAGRGDHDVFIEDIEQADPVGTGLKVSNTLRRMTAEPERLEIRTDELNTQIPPLEKQLGPWDDAEKLTETAKRHQDVLAQLRPKPQPAAAPVEKAAPDDAEKTLSGWDSVDGGTEQRRLSTAEQDEIRDIVRKTSGLKDITYQEHIPLPNGAPEWGTTGPSSAGGYYTPSRDAIVLALDSANPKAAYHEAFHRLQALFLTDAEKAVLRTELGRLRRMVASNEARRDQAARMSAKEIEAEAFGLWAAGLTKVKPHTVLKAGWERMAKMVRQIHNLLAGRGFQTSEDVFGAAKAGDIAQRFPKGFTGSTAPSFQLAYHGTPHAFDRFSTAKIGTGEGFQSFGWGLYFASLKDVAETYRQMLARDGGQVIKVDVPENSELMLWDKPLDEQPPAVKRALRSMVDVVKKPGIFSREPEKTFRAITREVLAGKDWHSTTGGQLYGMLARRLGKGDANQQAASKALLQAGIPGHRYLDAGSRADGDGSYNYVVYDDGRVSMLDSDIALPERTHFQENDDGFDADAADASYSLTENRIVNEVKGRFTDFTPSALAAIPLNYFTELARPSMTAVGEYLRVKRFLDAYRGKKHAAADVIAQQWLKYARLGLGKAGKAKAAILAQLMHDATLAGADPSQTDDETVNKPGYSALRATWLSLSPAGKELFSTVRDAYVDQANELDSILLDNVRKAQEISRRKAEEAYNAEIERINAAKMQPMAKADALREATETYKSSSTRSVWSAKARLTKMRLAFEASRVPTPYFPLARFGRYFVTVRDVDGTVLSFSRRERSMDRDILAGDMRDAFPTAKVEVGVVENVNEMRQAMDPRMVAEIEEIVGGAGFDSATMTNVMDQIWQRYLQTMPDLSARKRFIHRKGVHGFDSDALRSFSSHMFHAGHQMGRLKYGHELQELTNEASDQARKSDDPTKGMTLANELRLRHKWVMNPTGSSVAQVMSSAAFVWYLGATPAAAIVNMTQTPMIGIPVLAGKYGGFAKASAAVLKAAFDSVVGKGSVQRANLTKEELAALDNFYESGLIDRTQSHDLAGVGDTGVRYSPLKAKVMGILSWAFHRTEVWNREVTALAAFRLAKAAGEDFTQAVDSAHDLTWKTHFDYSNSSRPRMMQNDFAKVALVFRAYNINMLYRVFRDIHQAIKGETAQARKEARYQAAGVVGMMSLLGGVTGVIGFNTMMMLASAVLGDDDDPMDFEQQFKKDMLDILGPQLGGVVLNGVPGHYLGIDLTSRIGMPDLWFRSPTKDLQGKNEFDYWVMNSLGASVSMIGQAFQGISLIGEGKVERGVETMAPKWMRDLMKSYRYLNEGVTNLKGDEIMSADQIKPWDIIAQSIGFTPAKISETYDRNSALQNAESRVQQQRQQLVNRFALASRMGDMDGRADALAAIKVFNKVPLHRSMPITIDTLHQSLKTRDRNDKKREDGVLIENRPLGKKLRAMLPDRVY